MSTATLPDTAATGRRGPSTSQLGVVLFLASDVMLFAAFFAAWFLLRSSNEPWPPADVHLETARAAIATVVLVSTSFSMIAAERAAADERRGAARRWLLVTILGGLVFLGNQIAEYATLDFSASDHVFGSAYWALTGLHGAHVTAGIAALGLLFVRMVRGSSMAAISTWTHGVSLFWHLVDVVWVAVFLTIWVVG